MGVTTTSVLVLRHQDDRERDRVIFCLTPESGALRLRARGTKRSTSKLAGSLEPLTEVTVSFADGRVSGLITGAIMTERFPMLHQDLVASMSAQWLAELVERVAKPDHAAPELYTFVRKSFSEIATMVDQPLGQRWLTLDRMAFEILRMEGFVPALDHCPRCHRPMPAERIVFDPLVGFVHADEGRDRSLPLSTPSINYLTNQAISGSERTIFREVHALIESLITHTLDRPLKSMPVLRSVFRTSRLSTTTE